MSTPPKPPPKSLRRNRDRRRHRRPGVAATAAASAAARGPARAGTDALLPVLRDLSEVLAETVVALAHLRVGQHVVGLVDLLEPLLGARVPVDIGMVRPGQPPEAPAATPRGPRHATPRARRSSRGPSASPPDSAPRSPTPVAAGGLGRRSRAGRPRPPNPAAAPPPSGSTTPTTSWRAGSNGTPVSSSRRYPSPASTARACSRRVRTPSTIDRGSDPACSRARSMVSSTGRNADATSSRSASRSRPSSRAYRLRRLSRSATARRQRSSSSAAPVRAAVGRSSADPPGIGSGWLIPRPDPSRSAPPALPCLPGR